MGVTTNRALLDSILGDEVFRAGGVGTNFLDLRRTSLTFGELPADQVDLSLAALWCATRRIDADALWEDTRGWRAGAPAVTSWKFDAGEVQVTASATGDYSWRISGNDVNGRLISRQAVGLHAEIGGVVYQAHVIEAAATVHVFRHGHHAALTPQLTNDSLQVAGSGEQGSLLTPLPGTVVAVHVTSGQTVRRGAPLVTVEAMKMEHTLTAPRDGVVARVAFAAGDRVSAGAVLVELSAEA